jgi:hypothetical protein
VRRLITTSRAAAWIMIDWLNFRVLEKKRWPRLAIYRLADHRPGCALGLKSSWTWLPDLAVVEFEWDTRRWIADPC